MYFYRSIVVMVAIAVTCGSVSALTKEEMDGIRDAILPVLVECSKQHDVSMDSIKEAKAAHSVDGVDPCFLACIFKKTEFMNGSGKFDVETAKKHSRKYIHGEEDLKKSDETADECASVNEAEVSDGDKGCERAKLLAECLVEHRHNDDVQFLP